MAALIGISSETLTISSFVAVMKLAGSLVQDGHGILSRRAHSRRDFLAVKIVNFLTGILVGGIALRIQW